MFVRPFDLRFEFAPWRLSGIVYGALLNDPATLESLGEAVGAPPYKAPPNAIVLAIKPRNTLAVDGSSVPVPPEADEFEIGASLAVVIGRTACRVRAADVANYVAGWTLAADLSLPHDSLYRPAVRFKARDGSCLLGPTVVPCRSLDEAETFEIIVSIDDEPAQVSRVAGLRRGVAQLLEDVTDFVTLRAGDVLMLGAAHGAPRARAGQRFALDCPEIGRLRGTLIGHAAQEAA